MSHILIPVKMTIAIFFLDILYVACGDNNFYFSQDLIMIVKGTLRFTSI